MSGIYQRWINAWELRLAGRDTNRRIHPFEWGLDWLEPPDGAAEPCRRLKEYAGRVVRNSEEFFSYPTPSDFNLRDGNLTFSSPLVSPHPENNRVHAGFFPARRDGGRAVVVLPQWNADAGGHVGLCRLLNRFGVTALRLSLAYHDRRMPAGQNRADFHVSSNLGRTLHACRQSVVDARACLDWLEAQGYHRLGILGTSLGSCIAFIAAAHDARLRAGVFNHVSNYFGDVVWTGLATRSVRQSLDQAITQDELRECWAPISPATYVHRLAGRDMASLLVWARHDTTFLPAYSKQFIASMFRTTSRVRTACLPCAHYTTGEFPFRLMDGLLMCRFLAANL
jgi:hypothetical protein